MNTASARALEKCRVFYETLLKSRDHIADPSPDYSGQSASDAIKSLLSKSDPCMIARFGSGELDATLRYFDITRTASVFSKAIGFIKNETGPFWWDENIKRAMHNNAGFFPVNDKTLELFGHRMLMDIKNIDIMGSWLSGENRISHLFPNAKTVRLSDMEPYYHADPWSEILKNKKVLVIHPFEESIKKQYKKRVSLFHNPKILPSFELITLKAVQSIARNEVAFASWFDALDWMCNRIKTTPFDIALIGAGAYGLPLASFIKSIGKKAVHLGGATQILFGIKGKRWDERPFFQNLYNEYWVRPLPEENPSGSNDVEAGCYW